MKAVDSNSDGFLGKEEFSSFTRLNSNDKQTKIRKLQIIFNVSSISPDNRNRLFTNLDKDKNGKIDLDEFRALFKK